MKSIKVCSGPVCKEKGSERIKEKIDSDLQSQLKSDNINVEFCSCCGNCEFAPNIEVNGNVFGSVTEENVVQVIKDAPENKQEINIDDFLDDV